MEHIDRNEFFEKSRTALEQMLEDIRSAKTVRIEEFEPSKSALVLIDLVNGFIREGALKSERIERVITPAVRLLQQCKAAGIPVVAFADTHSEAAAEFASYPPHCIAGTTEAEPVTEIAREGGYCLIPKNSTNGFLECGFRKWLEEHGAITDFIIAGDCTDICVMQFALILKAFFNMQNIRSRLVVPVNLVETYDLGSHYGDLLNIMTLQIMNWNGIEIAKEMV